jgi:hypothetical protein
MFVYPLQLGPAMNDALLIAPVSTVALNLSQALNHTPGCLPNAYHHPRQRAEESHRLLLDPREWFAVCEQRAITRLAQPSWSCGTSKG